MARKGGLSGPQDLARSPKIQRWTLEGALAGSERHNSYDPRDRKPTAEIEMTFAIPNVTLI